MRTPQSAVRRMATVASDQTHRIRMSLGGPLLRTRADADWRDSRLLTDVLDRRWLADERDLAPRRAAAG